MSGQNIVRATGLLVIEAINSNPNGDPDRESDPRQRPDEKGEISPVSFKRKLRDLVENKEGPVWKELKTKFSLADDKFLILESRSVKRDDVKKELKSRTRKVANQSDNRMGGSAVKAHDSKGSLRDEMRHLYKELEGAG